MRRYLFLLSVASLVSLLAVPAFGQKKSNLQEYNGQTIEPTEEEIKAARRKAAGIQDLQGYGANKEPPPKPFPWAAVGLGLLVLGAMAPFGLRMYKGTRKDLEDLSTFGMGKGRKGVEGGEAAGAPSLSRRPPARALKAAKEKAAASADEAASPRDLVWDAVNGANGNWVTADWVASNAGLGAQEAADEIAALVSEGYLEEASDRGGKPVYRAPAA